MRARRLLVAKAMRLFKQLHPRPQTHLNMSGGMWVMVPIEWVVTCVCPRDSARDSPAVSSSARRELGDGRTTCCCAITTGRPCGARQVRLLNPAVPAVQPRPNPPKSVIFALRPKSSRPGASISSTFWHLRSAWTTFLGV